MKNKGAVALLITGGIAVIAIGASLGATFALYYHETNVINHVTIGTLAFDFKRTELKSTALNESGEFETSTDTNALSLNDNGADAITATSGAPGASYIATFELANTGATAFTTKIDIPTDSIQVEGATEEEKNTILPYVKVAFDDNEAVSLSETSLTYSLDEIKAQDKATFKVSVLLDSALGNEAQGTTVSFGLKLTMTQVEA